jgi:hypothetical protein
VNYQGVVYKGEHPALVDPAIWEAVNMDLREPEPKPQSIRTRQNALLSGVLFCKSCERPMIATYTVKGKHKYRYYVCQYARQKGWKACRTKSVSAGVIEDSLVAELRARLSTEESRRTVAIPEADWQAFLEGDPTCLVQSVVQKIRYDGKTGLVSVTLRPAVDSSTEVRSATFEFQLPAARSRNRPVFRHEPVRTADPPPRVARLVALAHRLEGLVRSGRVKDYAELAKLAHISTARIAQIVILGQLAPQIQEYVLFLSPEQAGPLSELQLRRIAREPRWDRQCASFRRLLSDGT